MVLSGTSDVTVSGNLFSGVRPEAIALEGPASRRILFANNVLTDAAGDPAQSNESLVTDNLTDPTAGQ